MSSVVDGAGAVADSRSRVRFTGFGEQGKGSSRTRVYCFPNAGGSATLYRDLALQLRPHFDVRAALLPGRDGRFDERPYGSWTELIASIVEAIDEDGPERYLLMGHSMGALLAFEVARALRRLGFHRADLLVISGRVGPRCPGPATQVSHLSDRQLVATVTGESGGIPAAVLADPGAVALYAPPLRTDMRLLEQYEYRVEALLDLPFLVFSGSADPLATPEQIGTWRLETCATFELLELTGDHWFIRQHAARIGSEITRQLAGSRSNDREQGRATTL